MATSRRYRAGNPTRGEHGFTTIAWMILALPLIMGLIGVSVDFYRLVQLRQNLDHRANIALIDASNEWAPSVRGGAVVESERVRKVVSDTYNEITVPWRATKGPGALSCPTVTMKIGTGAPVAPTETCVGYLYVDGLTASATKFLELFCQDATSVTTLPRMELLLKENLNTTFLHVVGVRTLTVPVVADAVIRAGNC